MNIEERLTSAPFFLIQGTRMTRIRRILFYKAETAFDIVCHVFKYINPAYPSYPCSIASIQAEQVSVNIRH
jgi:hypothetical protein